MKTKKKQVWSGYWDVECRNADGSLAWKERVYNTTMTAGLNDNLGVYFAAGTQKTAWYLGLVDNAGFTAFATTDTMASHGGWSENQNYSGGARPAWNPGAASGGSMTSSTPTVFNITASVTIKGLFLVSDNTQGGTAGVLYSAGAFAGSNQTLTNGQTLSCTYTVPWTGN